MQCSIATDCIRLPLHPTSIVKKVMKLVDIAFLTYFFDSLQMKEEVYTSSVQQWENNAK